MRKSKTKKILTFVLAAAIIASFLVSILAVLIQ